MAKAGVLGSITPTRSPGSTPACSSSVATRAAAASNSAKVNCRSSQRNATRLGLRFLDAMRLALRLVTGYLREVLQVPGSRLIVPGFQSCVRRIPTSNVAANNDQAALLCGLTPRRRPVAERRICWSSQLLAGHGPTHLYGGRWLVTVHHDNSAHQPRTAASSEQPTL